MWGFMQGGVVAQQWRSNSSLGKTPFFRSCTAVAQGKKGLSGRGAYPLHSNRTTMLSCRICRRFPANGYGYRILQEDGVCRKNYRAAFIQLPIIFPNFI
jgi:hypothetical protein